ncbi:valine--tRNA ligase [Madurella fahalii]|uniref:Valine--tRNA ligase n=1 Tax=Madurella fahalii TaxID=1157608 RepID=A0ABQ0FZL5_9PEZI
MATNSSRGNSIAAHDGPNVATATPPPPVPSDLKSQIYQQETASTDKSVGLHVSGQDADAVAPGGHVETVEEVDKSERKGR